MKIKVKCSGFNLQNQSFELLAFNNKPGFIDRYTVLPMPDAQEKLGGTEDTLIHNHLVFHCARLQETKESTSSTITSCLRNVYMAIVDEDSRLLCHVEGRTGTGSSGGNMNTLMK